MSEILTQKLIKTIEELQGHISVLNGVDSTQINESIQDIKKTSESFSGLVNASYKANGELTSKTLTAIQRLEVKLDGVQVPEQIKHSHEVNVSDSFIGFSSVKSFLMVSGLFLVMFGVTAWMFKTQFDARTEKAALEKLTWERNYAIGFVNYFEKKYKTTYKGVLKEFRASQENEAFQKSRPE